jgi:TRAP-type C4-dicarboxylate transport system permease small subunit
MPPSPGRQFIMFRRLLNRVFDVCGVLSAVFVFAIFAVMLASSVMRELGMRTGGTDDVVSWLTAAAAFFGLAHTFKQGDFVRVELLLEKLGERTRWLFEIGSLSIASTFCGYLAWSVCSYVYDSWQFNDMANGLIAIPIWIPQASVAVGSVMLFAAVADELIHVSRGGRPGYVVAVEERHARGDFSEDV